MARFERLVLVGVVVSVLGGCGGAPSRAGDDATNEPDRRPELGPLHVDADAHDFSRNPVVLDQIVRSRYAYFRFVAIPWSQATCDAFASALNRFPAVNLHGDPHVEQYTVVADAFGLDDFDRATTGPAVIDLSRFAGSLFLTSELKGWGDGDEVVESFLDAYLEAVDDPDLIEAQPSFVDRMRVDRGRTHAEFLVWADSLMEELSPEDGEAVEVALAQFGSSMADQDESYREGFFAPVSYGALHLGVGSGLVDKFLVRVAGPTDEPNDDVVIEFKEIQPEQPTCVSREASGLMLRPVIGSARLGRRHSDVLGFIPIIPESDYDGRPFWGRS
ncbi:MAG: DUF2252 family protein, partial [Deltaproteobacteria bacterium]|nr:DUF2252 family protein [Deltaproteobacteria bacterium]